MAFVRSEHLIQNGALKRLYYFIEEKKYGLDETNETIAS
jgi:hypothetical protein